MSAEAGSTRTRWVALALLVASAPVVARIYQLNPALGLVPETYSATLTAHSLARDGDVRLNEYFTSTDGQVPPNLGYAFPRRGDDILTCEPIFSPMTFAPFLLGFRDQPWNRLSWVNNTVAARLAAGALVLLGAWLLLLASPGRALLVTAIIGLATSHRTITGAGLWTHTSAALWLIGGLMLWCLGRTRPRLYPSAGFALACATACRPILLPAAALLVLDAWCSGRTGRRVALATTAAVVGTGLLALFANWHLHGSVLGGRAEIVAHINETHAVPGYFRFSLVHLAGLLVAPSRGLFVSSPVLLFAIPGLGRSLRRDADPTLRLVTAAGIVVFLLHGFVATWWGGWVFGPRYMTDLLPFFALWLALTPLPRRRRPLAGMLFGVSLSWSLAVQQVGVSAYPCGWNETPASVDKAPARLWDWHDTEIARCARKWAERRAGAQP